MPALDDPQTRTALAAHQAGALRWLGGGAVAVVLGVLLAVAAVRIARDSGGRLPGAGLAVLALVLGGVVAAAVGGLPTVVADGRSGLLVDGHHDGEWAAALRRVIVDDELHARLAAGARVQASEFSWDETAARTLAVYEQARARLREPA